MESPVNPGRFTLFIAGSKGFIAGAVNCSLAFTLGVSMPGTVILLATMLVGLLSYGISLVMFVLALRGLGTVRTGAYFSTAPFIGADMSLALLGESTTPEFWLASALMGLGVWLHLTERHEHEHTHELLEHRHRHLHDEHHQHSHESSGTGKNRTIMFTGTPRLRTNIRISRIFIIGTVINSRFQRRPATCGQIIDTGMME